MRSITLRGVMNFSLKSIIFSLLPHPGRLWGSSDLSWGLRPVVCRRGNQLGTWMWPSRFSGDLHSSDFGTELDIVIPAFLKWVRQKYSSLNQREAKWTWWRSLSGHLICHDINLSQCSIDLCGLVWSWVLFGTLCNRLNFTGLSFLSTCTEDTRAICNYCS